MSQPQFSQFAWGTAARLRLSGAALENATAFGGLSQSRVSVLRGSHVSGEAASRRASSWRDRVLPSVIEITNRCSSSKMGTRLRIQVALEPAARKKASRNDSPSEI